MANNSSTLYPAAIDEAPELPSSSDRSDAAVEAIQSKLGINVLAAADGAISVSDGVSREIMITKAGVCALTLAAPAADRQRLTVTSTTANAHTITTVDLIHDGTTGTHDLATFAAFPGASLSLIGYDGKWYVVANNAVTITT
jgi:hypothetical protein